MHLKLCYNIVEVAARRNNGEIRFGLDFWREAAEQALTLLQQEKLGDLRIDHDDFMCTCKNLAFVFAIGLLEQKRKRDQAEGVYDLPMLPATDPSLLDIPF